MVAADERAKVITVASDPIDFSGRSPSIEKIIVDQRIRIDRDDRHLEVGGRLQRIVVRRVIVADYVIDDHRLGAANKDRGGQVVTASEPIERALTSDTFRVVFDDAVCQTQISLMNFDNIESSERTFDSSDTATKGNHRMIDTACGEVPEEYAAPITRSR